MSISPLSSIAIKRVEAKAFRHVSRFARDDDGVVTAMGLFFVLMMCLVGGIGVDLMRNEMERTQVQGTLDRAVIAASDMNQPLPPADVVRDYFAKAGLSDFLGNGTISVKDSLTSRQVSATANGTSKNMFMSVMGRPTLPVYGRATAAQGVTNIEVSLVLDISGSMGGTKIEQMRTAASEFVDIVLAPVQAETVTVSLVPYNGKVNAGSLMDDYFEFTNQHSASNCVRFSDAQFNMPGLSNAELPERLAHFDKNSGPTTNFVADPHCQTSDYGAIKPWSNDPVALKTHIAGLDAGGWTAIDLAMKWATVLLDPTSQDELSNMATDGHVEPQFVGRPSFYLDPINNPGAPLTMKVVVLMTDGANTNQYDLKPEFKSGQSDIYKAVDPDNLLFPDQNLYSVYDATLDQFYWLEEKTWNPLPKGADAVEDLTDPQKINRLSNVQAFGTWPVNYIAQTFYGDAEYVTLAGDDRFNEIADAALQYGNGSIGDANLDNICNSAKEAGIIVFSVAFEAPQAGQDALESCASTAGHYFDVEGANLSDAFAAIARQISQLRLTQ